LADRFAGYIYDGTWPREAVEQLGNQEGSEEQGPDAPLFMGKAREE
jgi:hypothetical protein